MPNANNVLSRTTSYRGLLPDWQIADVVNRFDMINPFVPEQVAFDDNGKKVVSYGLSSYGYDIRLGRKFKVFNPRRGGLIDPLADPKSVNYLDDEEGDYCDIAPGSYILGYTVEKFRMPDNVRGIVYGKSTYARLGLNVNTTPLEPGWIGYLTIELGNETPCPMRVYANMGIGQVEFVAGDEPKYTYSNRKTGVGKYQYQGMEPVTARLIDPPEQKARDPHMDRW